VLSFDVDLIVAARVRRDVVLLLIEFTEKISVSFSPYSHADSHELDARFL
jgi:hypothetical protein